MRKKLKPDQDLEAIKSDLIETVCNQYQNDISIRTLAKKCELSPMKVRKILITGGVYATDLSTEIAELYKDGKTVGEIAEILSMSRANVNAYLPYERIIYNMEEKSVEADRQQRYRDRKKAGIEQEKKSLPRIERVRNQTMIFVIGKKLRRLLPNGVFDRTTDPLARDTSYTWGSNLSRELQEAADPDRNIWCADLTINGRGKNKKIGVVLESANCGFVVISPLPPVPDLNTADEMEKMNWSARLEAEEANEDKLKAYRIMLIDSFINAIRLGMLEFCLPEDRVLDYIDTIARVELVKGKPSTPATRLEELIERELQWEPGADPVEHFNVRGNWTSRKFGNSGFYRHVDTAVQRMLEMSIDESQKWMETFLSPHSK